MLDFNKIFLGNTPSEQRKYLLYFFEKIVGKYDTLMVPAVGQFAIPKIAIEAGFRKSSIYTSDISLFSTILGYLFSGKRIDSIGFTLADNLKGDYKSRSDDIDRAAYLFWLMKSIQIKGKNYYEQVHKDHVLKHKRRHINHIADELRAYVKFYAGLRYEIKDLRQVINEGDKDNVLVVINPPAYSRGYERMFDFGEALQFDSGIDEFNWSKEYSNLYEKSKGQKATFLWYRYQNTTGLPSEDLLFAKEYTADRYDYWLCTKADRLKALGVKPLVSFKKEGVYRPIDVKIIPPDYQITEKTKISFKQASEGIALYYRDLWAHKLGSTKAESYFLMFLDGMAFGTIGFHLQECRSLKSDSIFEVYGFTAPLNKYLTANRLLMLAITTKQFRDFLYSQTCKRNRIARMEEFKTTCLSKYRKVKLNNNLLTMRSREKMKNGMYKIVYVTPFYDRSYSDCVGIFLKELKNGKGRKG